MRKLIVITLILLPFLAKAQDQLTAFRNTVEDGYNFWLYNPSVMADTMEKQEVKPLIIFLHGKSLSGSNLYQAKKYGTINAIEMGRQIDAFVVNPQTNNGWDPKRILNVLDWTVDNYNVDTNRIYVIGMSMGGYGTINFVGTYPEKVAAAMAFCGGGTLKDYCGLNDVPLWIVHGTADRAVSVEQSDKVVAAMESCGATDRLIYSRWPGVNHSVLARMFYMNETYEWLFSHSLTDENRAMNDEVIIEKGMLDNAYRGLSKSDATVDLVDNTKSLDKQSRVTNTGNSNSVYVVRQGDTLGAIAKKYNTTVTNLCRINGLKETSILQIGQKIKVQ